MTARRVVTLSATAVLLACSAVGCGSDSTSSDGVGSATSVVAGGTSAPTAPARTYDVATLPTVTGVAELADELTAAGMTCTLAYEGIRDESGLDRIVSICTIDDEQAYLYLWNKPAELQAFANDPGTAGSPVVVGGNWSISTGTQPTAARVATATGGAPLF